MTKIVYEIIQHDHGWAFKLGDTISQGARCRPGTMEDRFLPGIQDVGPRESQPLSHRRR